MDFLSIKSFTNNSFTSTFLSFIAQISFSHLALLTNNTGTASPAGVRGGHTYLACTLSRSSRSASSVWSLFTMLSLGWVCACVMCEHTVCQSAMLIKCLTLSLLSCLSFLKHPEWLLNFVKWVEINMWFFFPLDQLLWWIILIEFIIFHPWNEPYFIMIYKPSNELLLIIFWRVFHWCS